MNEHDQRYTPTYLPAFWLEQRGFNRRSVSTCVAHYLRGDEFDGLPIGMKGADLPRLSRVFFQP